MGLPSMRSVLLGSCSVVLLALLAALPAAAVTPVEAVALFKDRAVVRTVGGQEMVKRGETSKHGVTLLAADPFAARVRYRGEEYTLTLSARVASSFTKPTEDVVRISRDDYGQYRMRGAINGNYVDFLIDTGASVVAMSQVHAESMGLDFRSGQPGMVQTAQGNANAYFVMLDEVKLGGITRNKVRATVIQGTYPVDVLLGMSFLNQLQLSDKEGVLTLTAKF
jgi:aspartyl protease family protein